MHKLSAISGNAKTEIGCAHNTPFINFKQCSRNLYFFDETTRFGRLAKLDLNNNVFILGDPA